jgi:hypothetical protein
VALVAIAALPALAACTSGGGSQASPTASSISMTDAQIQVLVDDLVRCIRENGAPGMPDVTVVNRKIIEPDENVVDEVTKRNIDTALAACESVENRIPDSAFEEEPPDEREELEEPGPRPEDVPALRRFAECMRQNGVPDFPDPRGDGTFPYNWPGAGEGKSPRLMAGRQACRQYWDGNLTFTP